MAARARTRADRGQSENKAYETRDIKLRPLVVFTVRPGGRRHRHVPRRLRAAPAVRRAGRQRGRADGALVGLEARARAGRRTPAARAAPAGGPGRRHGCAPPRGGRRSSRPTAGSTSQAGVVRIPIDDAMEQVLERRVSRSPARQRPAGGGHAGATSDGFSTCARRSTRPQERVCSRMSDAARRDEDRPRNEEVGGRAGDCAGAGLERVGAAAAVHGRGCRRSAAGHVVGARARRRSRRSASTRSSNAQVPLDVVFRDETGRPVKLGDYFGKRPVVLALVYYECPMLCTQVLNGARGGAQGAELQRRRGVRRRHASASIRGRRRRWRRRRRQTYLDTLRPARRRERAGTS